MFVVAWGRYICLSLSVHPHWLITVTSFLNRQIDYEHRVNAFSCSVQETYIPTNFACHNNSECCLFCFWAKSHLSEEQNHKFQKNRYSYFHQITPTKKLHWNWEGFHISKSILVRPLQVAQLIFWVCFPTGVIVTPAGKLPVLNKNGRPWRQSAPGEPIEIFL